jgi:DNA-binding transcriptional ArsR family regulator
MSFNFSSEQVKSASHCLKILGNPVRLKIVSLLANKSQTVMELADTVSIPHNVACEHLRLLQHCNFLSSTREGRQVRYHLKDKHIFDLLKCIKNRFKK